MFAESTIKSSPNSEDILFLASAMRRNKVPARKVTGRSWIDGTKFNSKLPVENAKKAVLLVSPLNIPEGNNKAGRKLSVAQAIKLFKTENGLLPDSPDPRSLSIQRDFYDRIPSFLNRDDLRSWSEPETKFEMKHWIRSKWVVHDMRDQVARNLRCDWYREHLTWGNELDQLSFAFIVARHELERKFGRRESDDERIPEPWEDYP